MSFIKGLFFLPRWKRDFEVMIVRHCMAGTRFSSCSFLFCLNPRSSSVCNKCNCRVASGVQLHSHYQKHITSATIYKTACFIFTVRINLSVREFAVKPEMSVSALIACYGKIMKQTNKTKDWNRTWLFVCEDIPENRYCRREIPLCICF